MASFLEPFDFREVDAFRRLVGGDGKIDVVTSCFAPVYAHDQRVQVGAHVMAWNFATLLERAHDVPSARRQDVCKEVDRQCGLRRRIEMRGLRELTVLENLLPIRRIVLWLPPRWGLTSCCFAHAGSAPIPRISAAMPSRCRSRIALTRIAS